MRSLFIASFIFACTFGVVAKESNQFLSNPNSWNKDFTRLSPPTLECPGGSLKQLKTRMSVSGPYTAAKYKLKTSSFVKTHISKIDRLHSFRFSSDPNQDNYWGFNGYLVSRGNCVVQAEVVGYDN